MSATGPTTPGERMMTCVRCGFETPIRKPERHDCPGKAVAERGGESGEVRYWADRNWPLDPAPLAEPDTGDVEALYADILGAITGDQLGDPDSDLYTATQAAVDAVLRSDWLRERDAARDAAVARAARAEALTEAADELRRQAVARFGTHGPHDSRGAALWDAACHINPDDGDALRARAAAVTQDGEQADA